MPATRTGTVTRFNSQALIQAQIREMKVRTRNWELRNAKLEGELIDRAELLRALEVIAIAIKEVIAASKLADREKEQIALNIAQLPMLVNIAAERQAHVEYQEEEKEAKRRGRPKGSKNRPKSDPIAA